MQPDQQHNMPLRKFRLALGLTTAEAGQYANVTRKTWEAWEAGEVAGKAAPKTPVELVYSKLDRICDAQKRLNRRDNFPEIVNIFLTTDPVTGQQMPIDAVASDNYLGIEEGPRPGTQIIKSMAIAWGTGRPYVHKTVYVVADNLHVQGFLGRHQPVG